MEELKLLMDDIVKERERTDRLIEVHNALASDYACLKNKHNKLCKSVVMLSFACLGLDLLVYLNYREISKLRKEKENKEG